MAFCPKNLRIVACAGNFTLWHYNSEDEQNDIVQNNYFADACCLRSGDVIIIESKNGHNDVNIKLYAVSHEPSKKLMQK